MSELTTFARPYAKAAFEYAQHQKKLENWATALEALALILEDQNAYEFIANPTIKREDKISLLLGFVPEPDKEIKPKIQNFLNTLAEFNRLTMLPEIATVYHNYRSEFDKSMEVSVISAKPLDSKQEQSLIKALCKRLNRDVSLNVEINDSLLGGAVIQAGDFVIDGSVRGKLDKLAAELTN